MRIYSFFSLVFAVTTCEICKPIFELLSTNLQTLESQANNLRGETRELSSSLSGVQSGSTYFTSRFLSSDGSTDYQLQTRYIQDVVMPVDAARSDANGISTRMLRLRDDITTLRNTIDEFDCACGNNNTNGCPCVGVLKSISNDTSQITRKFDDYSDWMTNRWARWDDDFSGHASMLRYEIKTAIDRLYSPSGGSNSWSVTRSILENDDPFGTFRSQVVNSQLEGRAPLSDEGLLLVDANEWAYKNYLVNYTIADMISGWSASTNSSVDLGPITNYLFKVQQPYYQMYNSLRLAIGSNPYQVDRWEVVTNFFGMSYGSREERSSAWINMLSPRRNTSVSNWFQRIELHLLNLQGLLGSSDSIFDTVEEEQDFYSLDSIGARFDEMTNGLHEVERDFSGVSNRFSNLVKSYEAFRDAFKNVNFEGDSGYLRITPGFVMGDVEFEHIDLSLHEYDDIKDTVRSIAKVLYYCGFIGVIVGFVWLCVVLVWRVVSYVLRLWSGE